MFKLFIVMSLLCVSSLHAENLFAKFDVKKDWKIKRTDEYSKIKPTYKKGAIGFVTKHTSESYYFRISTEKELKTGQTYDLSFNAQAKGEGDIYVSYAARPPKGKIQVLGLRTIFSAAPQWKTYKCTFTVPEKKESNAVASFIVSIGEFKGQFNLKDLKLVKSDHTGKISKKGLIEELK
ncbi:hypothetical protein LNTAR_07414 [Lentisphaera araneosa HTCC2155]|uniref:CBM-cenC domain-containing protein n=1 Tax=Lentisphaera araneosa HTCC2155 TaxID=313628 RepID=A6DN18_9BACT|nr:carbohydrate binding domain-containing protein [Lentisphaera araneosa]EDM27054.1 hypothetical protein LNTAR_07414 [Lentisphaera araneosa HTCC2155]